jgi:hypothetical protein
MDAGRRNRLHPTPQLQGSSCAAVCWALRAEPQCMTQEPPHLLASAGAHESTPAAGRSLYVRGQQARIIGNGRDDLEEVTIN